MRMVDIEGWALRVVDAVRAGQHIEDARVELKAIWPDPIKSARRLTGHLNASRGDDVLWLIGLDEKRGVVGAAAADTAMWWASVAAEFVDVVPTPTDVAAVTTDGPVIVALHFTSEAAPYVVRNPAHGTAGNVVEREVPWREATGVRSVRRSDLVRLLLPQVQTPRVEVLSASASVTQDRHNKIGGLPAAEWNVWVSLYFEIDLGASVVIPWHRVAMTLTSGSVSRRLRPQLTGHTVSGHGGERSFFPGPKVTVATIHTGAEQVLIEGPGRLTGHGNAREALTDELHAMAEDAPATLNITWRAVDADRPQRLVLEVSPREPQAYAPQSEEPLWQRRWSLPDRDDEDALFEDE